MSNLEVPGKAMNEIVYPPNSIRILVDAREHALADALERLSEGCAFCIERKALDVADVQIVHADAQADADAEAEDEVLLAIERKTGLDFAASVRDGRYHEQKRRLVDAVGKDRVAYVLEGRMAHTRRFLEWEDPRVRGCLLALQIKHRTPVVCTLDVVDTAAFVVAAAKHVSSALIGGNVSDIVATYETLAVKASSACKRRNVDPRMCFLQQLCQIPGISTTIANHIAEAAGGATCMRQLFKYIDSQPSATKALLSIPMVGAKTAASIMYMLYNE
jgi:ERCC4-type nuclease